MTFARIFERHGVANQSLGISVMYVLNLVVTPCESQHLCPRISSEGDETCTANLGHQIRR
jgi:hypothetical protein